MSDVAVACREYRESLSSDECEVWQYLRCDQSAVDWVRRHAFKDKMEIHHIKGRPLPTARNHWCNLIQVSDAAHDWGHDNSPLKFELACWFAKWKKHLANLDAEDTWMRNRLTDIERVHFDDWHIESLDRIVTPYINYGGRIAYLTTECQGTPFQRYGEQILKYLKG